MLADKLNMTPDEAERWIVNLIRNARLDAKIDSKLVRPSRGTSVVYNPPQSPPPGPPRPLPSIVLLDPPKSNV